MLRTVLFLLTGLIVLILSLPFAVIVWLFGKKGKFDPPPKAGVFFVQLLSKILCFLAGCDLEISGQENIQGGPVIYAGNHQGNFDTLLINFALGEPKVIMAKKEASYIPVAHIWMSLIRCIFVDRKNVRRAAAAMKTSEEYLKKGFPVLYFPEGTRSQGPDMGPFKNGAFRTAISCGVPIVPFVIDGSYRVYEENHRLKKSKVKVRILPAVTAFPEENSAELSARVKGLVQSELDRIRSEA